MSEEKNLITFSEAAELRNTTLPAIYDMVKRKKFTVVMENGEKRLSRDEVKNYEKGQSGRPTKNVSDDVWADKSEIIGLKIEHPENYYPTVFNLVRDFLRLAQERMDDDALVINRFKNKTFKDNKRKFRLAFPIYTSKVERVFQKQAPIQKTIYRTTILLNQTIIVERVYENKEIQDFFEYFMGSQLALTEDENVIEKALVGFLSKPFNTFSDLIEKITSLKEKNISVQSSTTSQNNQQNLENDPSFQQAVSKLDEKKKGRPRPFVDKKGKIKGGLDPNTTKAIDLFNGGKTGKEIGSSLFPRLQYNLRKQKMKYIAKRLEYHFLKNNFLFTRSYDIKVFRTTI